MIKHETALGVHGPGSGTYEHTGRKGQYRYKPYDKKDSRQSGYTSSQFQKSWQQFSFRGKGRGDLNSPYFTKTSRNSKQYK